MTASLAASSPVLRRPLLSFAVRSDFLLKPRISARFLLCYTQGPGHGR